MLTGNEQMYQALVAQIIPSGIYIKFTLVYTKHAGNGGNVTAFPGH